MILFIDDEWYYVYEYVEVLREALRNDGITVKFVDTVQMALQVMEEQREQIRLIVLDIQLISYRPVFTSAETEQGQKTGVLLLPRLRQMAPNAPVALLTNVNYRDVRNKDIWQFFQAQDCCHYFYKPQYDQFRFADEIRGILDRYV